MSKPSWLKKIVGLRAPLVFLIVAGAGFLDLWWAPVSRAQKPMEITILHTNNVTGHLFGCPT